MITLKREISSWSEKFVLRGEEEGVVNVESVSSYQRGGLCRLPRPRNACFLTLVAKHDGSLRLNFEVE